MDSVPQTPTAAAERHIPVLLQEVLSLLKPERGGVFLDVTLGLGGHAEALLAANPDVKLIGLDQDSDALELAAVRLAKFGDRVKLIEGNFGDLKSIIAKHKLPKFDGVLADLGVSSMQLDEAERGFSFRFEAPLDMRMDPYNNAVTAFTIVNTWLPDQLVRLFRQYGDERFAMRIVRDIVEKRKKKQIQTTTELSELLVNAYPLSLRHKRPHPATRVFQALRIEVNREIEVLESFLQAAPECLAKDGVLAVITFHSLEDRPVKYEFRGLSGTERYELLTKKALVPTEEEEKENPRSRSAKVRGLKRVV